MYIYTLCIFVLCGFRAVWALQLPVMRSLTGIFASLTVDGLSVDWVNEKLYWTDATLQHIEVYDTTNGNRRVLIRTGNTTKPRAIVVDPATR